MKRRQELITKQGIRFKVANQDNFDHQVKILSHYFIRGVDPIEWPRGRDMDANKSTVRRGGLDIFYVIDERDKTNDLGEADNRSKL
jgi:hypothetical protein